MAEPTNPGTGVMQEPPDILKRIQDHISHSEEHGESVETQQAPEQSEVAVQQPEGQASSEELTLEDLPGELPGGQPEVDAFTLVHNGQEVKLNRAEAIAQAQQGFDYTRKAQALAEKNQQVEAALARLSQVESVQPQMLAQLAEVRALEAQVKQYENVDWVALAAQNQAEWSVHRARFDQILGSYNRAVTNYNHTERAVKQQVGQVAQQALAAEAQRIPDFIPEWKDNGKREAGIRDLVKHYGALGITPTALNAKLTDAFSLAVAHKAMKYDQLLRAKTDKVKQLRTAPPVTRPGSSTGSSQTDLTNKAMDRLKRTGDVKDAAAVLLNRWTPR